MLREQTGSITAPPHLNPQVAAYNYPAWHPSPFMEEIFGKGWTEFDLLRSSGQLFPGHAMPRHPLWGYFNEADPEWAAKEIDLAADYGLDTWMIDWYWHDGAMFYHEQLEEGFLSAPNRDRLKFALMWANHDWKNIFPGTTPGDSPVILAQRHGEEDTMRAIEYCIERYFSQPNYWRIDGRLVFGIFSLNPFLEAFSEDGLKRIFDQVRERVLKAGLGEMHLQLNGGFAGLEERIHEFGIDSAVPYHCFPWTYFGKPGRGRTPYGEGCVGSIKMWRDLREQCQTPLLPTCPVGWDDSPRYGGNAHVTVQRTPDQFERLLIAAQRFLAESPPSTPKVVYINAWNEWTEDSYLLPDSTYGYSYLEAVRRAFGRGYR